MGIINRSRVAIIMSVYRFDSSTALIESIESILDQSYSCDIYIYRDGLVSSSIDSILKRVEIYSNVYVYYSVDNKGLANALNCLIDIVVELKYEYVARMDSDDISHVDRVYQQVLFMDNHKEIDLSGTFCHEFGSGYSKKVKKLPQMHEDLIDFSIVKCPFIHPTVIFRMNIFRDGYRYPVNTVLTEDLGFWFVLLNSGYRFGNINKVLLDYRLTDDTILRRRGLGKAINEVKIRTYHMVLMKRITLKNCILILARFFFHLSPKFLMKIMYKILR